jgi:ABC-type multidrug transport system fused ATPase/permease subunit
MRSGEEHHEGSQKDHGNGHHDHGAYDPHIWLDLGNATKMVDTITEGLCAADPQGSELFRKNAAAFRERLSALDAKFRETLGTCGKKTIIHGGHFAFGYLAHRYGLEYVSAYEGSPNAEPTARKIIALKKKMDENGIRYVYFEELINPKVSELLSRETGATLLYLHGAHNLTKDEFEKGATFISLMEKQPRKPQEGPRMQMTDVVRTENLSFRFNGVEILSDITFALEKGEFLGIVGPNGSGKTTLIRLLLGLIKPTRGTIALFGRSADAFTQWRKIGYLPQKIAAFNPHFPATVEEIVALGLLGGKSFPRRVARTDRKSIDEAMAPWTSLPSGTSS